MVVGGKEGRQTVSELEESEAEKVGCVDGGVGCCHIHPYHSGRQFSKCLFFLRGATAQFAY